MRDVYVYGYKDLIWAVQGGSAQVRREVRAEPGFVDVDLVNYLDLAEIQMCVVKGATPGGAGTI